MTRREEALVREVISRHDALKKVREPHEDLWHDITELVLPVISDILEDSGDHIWTERLADNFNSVGRDAVRLWSNGMQGYMTPRNNNWVRVTSANKEIRKLSGMRKYFQETTEEVLAHWRRSNFYDMLGPVYEHGASVATSALTVDWDSRKRSLAYIPRHPKQVWIAEDYLGHVDTVFIVEELSWRQIVAKFGEEALDEPDRKTAIRAPFEKKEVLHAVFPRTERLVDQQEQDIPVDARRKPIASIWILLGRNHLLKESGYDTMREIVWRFRRTVGTPYGYGPSHNALIDLLRAEKIDSTMLRAADLAVMPPLMYPQELAGKLKIQPHGMTPYSDPRRKVEPVFTVGQYPYGLDMLNRVEESIRRHYHIDFWLMLSQSQQGQRTAYEVAQLAGEKAAVMGAEIGRVESELLDPIIDVSLTMLQKEGLLPDPPEELADLDEPDVMFSYDGPLAQMQKRHYGQQNIIQMLNQVTLIGQVFPRSLVWLDDDELMQEALESLEAPESVIRDKASVDKIRQAEAAAQQMQMQMEQAQQAAELQATLAKANPTGLPPGMGGA